MGTQYLRVDKIINNGLIAEATDIKKIYHNLELMGDYGKEIEQLLNIKLLLVEKDADAIFSIGRFICVMNIEKNESSASMIFFDCKLYTEDMWHYLAGIKYPNHIEKFMKFYGEAFLSSLSSELDNFEFSLD